jgi:hypothetical protein
VFVPVDGVSSAGEATKYLSVNGICQRWSCGRTFAYEAIHEMDRAGYLERFYVGKRDLRIAVESLEQYERLHSRREQDPEEREVNDWVTKSPPARREPQAPLRSQAGSAAALRDAWKKLKASRH